MKTDDDRIANGECISEMGVDHCPKCVDMCEAFHWKVQLAQTLQDAQVTQSPEPPKQ